MLNEPASFVILEWAVRVVVQQTPSSSGRIVTVHVHAMEDSRRHKSLSFPRGPVVATSRRTQALTAPISSRGARIVSTLVAAPELVCQRGLRHDLATRTPSEPALLSVRSLRTGAFGE